MIPILLFVLGSFATFGQCSTVAVQISAQDTTYVQMCHAGFFNIPSGIDNVCIWEVTDFWGEIIHQDTTSGASNDQSTSLFNHMISIQDSMKATIVITNETEGIICSMSDTLYWREDEVIPGSIIGYWDVLSSNGGTEEDISTSTKLVVTNQNIEINPSLVKDFFTIKGDIDTFSLNIFDASGQFMRSFKKLHAAENIDISRFSKGIYFLQIKDENSQTINVKKIVKI